MIFFKNSLTWSLLKQNILVKRGLFQLSCQTTPEFKLIHNLKPLSTSIGLANRKISTSILVNECQKKCSNVSLPHRNYSSTKTTTTSDSPDNKASPNSELIIQHHNDGTNRLVINFNSFNELF